MTLLQSIPSVWEPTTGRFNDGIERVTETAEESYVHKVERGLALDDLRQQKRRDETRLMRELRGSGKPTKMVVAYRSDGSVWQYASPNEATACNGLRHVNSIYRAIAEGSVAGRYSARFCYLGHELNEPRRKPRHVAVVVGDQPYPSIDALARAYHVSRRVAERWVANGRVRDCGDFKPVTRQGRAA